MRAPRVKKLKPQKTTAGSRLKATATRARSAVKRTGAIAKKMVHRKPKVSIEKQVVDYDYSQLRLPASVVSLIDILRLTKELERVDVEMTTSSVQARLNPRKRFVRPLMSDPLTDFLRLNQLLIDEGRIRIELIRELKKLKTKLPVIHMTFAVTADRDSLEQLVTWVRQSINPRAVLVVGLQPTLVAGVYLRTPNHVYDFSLRSALNDSQSRLVGQLEELRGGE
ncbi:MAG: F0F1 ATP synthase subunit delta [Candidatus Saccharimonas sp.]